jgi:hypothetical protein
VFIYGGYESVRQSFLAKLRGLNALTELRGITWFQTFKVFWNFRLEIIWKLKEWSVAEKCKELFSFWKKNMVRHCCPTLKKPSD